MAAIEQELLDQIGRLDKEQRKRVLDFVRELTRPKGELIRSIVEDARRIAFPHEDLEEMKRIIEEECERIDLDDWDEPTFPA